MKSRILIVLLAALSVGNFAAFAQGPDTNPPTEIITRDEVLLPDGYFVQDEDVTKDEQTFLDEVVIKDIKNTNSDVSSKRDVLLLRNTYSVTAHWNVFHSRIIAVKGNPFLSIERIRFTYIGWGQNTDASIIAGGLGRNFVSVMLQSQKDLGFNIQLEIWGR